MDIDELFKNRKKGGAIHGNKETATIKAGNEPDHLASKQALELDTKQKVSKKKQKGSVKKHGKTEKEITKTKVVTIPAQDIQVVDHTQKKEFKKIEVPDEDGFGDSRNRRKTEDGLPVYYDTELNIGLGKDTPDCPFDCDCCF
jgi:hypothetical protein